MVGVSRSTVSLLVRDIELTEEQHEALQKKNAAYSAQRTGSAAWSARCRKLRHEAQIKGRLLARRGDPLHAAGCILYWAEGDKKQHRVSLSNSDPEVLRFFATFLRTYFDVPNEKLRVHCNLFADHVEDQVRVEDFWLDVLDLPRTCLWRSTINTYSKHSAKKRKNMLPYGTCKLSVWLG